MWEFYIKIISSRFPYVIYFLRTLLYYSHREGTLSEMQFRFTDNRNIYLKTSAKTESFQRDPLLMMPICFLAKSLKPMTISGALRALQFA